jgi:hypothetical protein
MIEVDNRGGTVGLADPRLRGMDYNDLQTSKRTYDQS